MNKTVILYGSKYGTTKIYAEKLSEMTGFECFSYTANYSIESYDTIVLMGALYAGGVKGLKETVKKLSSQQHLIIVTNGLADPKEAENIENIRQSVERQVGATWYNKASIYHLRGGVNYGRLNLAHRVLMKLLYQRTKGLPTNEITPERKTFLETYGKEVTFIDFSDLIPICEHLGIKRQDI